MRRRNAQGEFVGLKLPNQKIAEQYRNGVSVKALAAKYSVSRGVIRTRLLDLKIPIRGIREASHLFVSQQPKERWIKQTEAAHKASKGRRARLEERVKRAQTNQALSKMNETEQKIFDVFEAANIKVIPQYALQGYNIDFAVPEWKLAIEIDGGNWHASPSKRTQDRGKEVLLSNREWGLIRVKVARGKLMIITNKVYRIEYSAVINAICSNPSIWS